MTKKTESTDQMHAESIPVKLGNTKILLHMHDVIWGLFTKIPSPTDEEKVDVVREVYQMLARSFDKDLNKNLKQALKAFPNQDNVSHILQTAIGLQNAVDAGRFAETHEQLVSYAENIYHLAETLMEKANPKDQKDTTVDEKSLREKLIEQLSIASSDDEVANILNNYHPHVGEMTIINEYLKKVRLILETERGEDTSIYATLNDLCQVITNAAVWMWQRELKNDYKSDDATTMLSSRFAHLQDTVEKCLATIMYGATHYRTVDETERLLQYLVEVIIGYLQGNQSDTEDTESSATFTPIDQPENSGVSLKEMVEFLKKCEVPTENIPKAMREIHNLIEQMNGEILPPSPFGGPESIATGLGRILRQQQSVDAGEHTSAPNQEKAQSECRGFKELRYTDYTNWDRMRKQLFNEFRENILVYGSPAMRRFCFNCSKLGSCTHYENVMNKRMTCGGVARQSELPDLEAAVRFDSTEHLSDSKSIFADFGSSKMTAASDARRRAKIHNTKLAQIQKFGDDYMREHCWKCEDLVTCTDFDKWITELERQSRTKSALGGLMDMLEKNNVQSSVQSETDCDSCEHADDCSLSKLLRLRLD